MTELVADSQLNMSDFLQHADLSTLFDSGNVITQTATEFQIQDPSTQEILTLTGTFDYGPPATGTITGGSFVPGTSAFGAFTFSNASISVSDFTNFVQTNDVVGLFQEIFQGADTITGSAQADVLIGFEGNDVVNGGAGNDFLIGGLGADTLTGGTGNDTFFGTASALSGDTITDFSFGDRIVISDATLADFTFSLSGETLTFGGGSLTVTHGVHGALATNAASSGGVQLTIVPRALHNDFDGDRHSDILWRNNDTGYLTEWLGTSTGGFSDNSAHAGMSAADSSWQVAGTGDFNGDGRADILWRNTVTGVVADQLGNQDGSFAPGGTNGLNGAVDNSWHIAGTGDFNGDGLTDVLWRTSGGYLTEWRGAANGTFTDNGANAASGAADNSWQIAGTGDFNGDGHADILWRNASGYVTEWLGTASGGFTDNAGNAATGAADNSWQIVGTGDFNGDGHTDILWRNTGSGYVTEWLGTSTGAFTDNAVHAATGAADNGWQIVSIGDFNGDGADDLLWRNSSGYTTEWLGTSTGGFTDNAANAATGAADNGWHVQDPFV